MSFSSRGRLNWWMGAVISASLLGACGSPDEKAGEVPVEGESARDAVAGDVAVKLSTPRQSLAAREDVSVTVTLTNVSKDTVRVLKWHTPTDGLKEDLFAITVDGAPVEYQGRHYKWATPQATDYLRLAAGESVSYTVDLGATYDFSRTGNYSLRYDSDAHGSAEGVSQLRSEDLSLFVEGRAFVGPEATGTVSAMALSTANCSAARTTQVTTAFNDAKTMSTGAINWLNNPPSPYTRYITWFGTYSVANKNIVLAHFNSILSAFNTKSVIVDCGCTDSAYAYVYKNQPYRIYVCNAFWPAPPTGTDSKAGTLIHEMSHFTVVADTDDHGYGQSTCKTLARNNPANARDNADSHEYFAENTPALP
ncbi:extracellular protease [Myxococcus stipitatus DSM 14675]|uniref:Extracellular protease n=2 Tax=Myxococcus stipitatus TaxID=83455 RepID=L7ULM3_MYXSD|nr:extracellular protease [Myxococcus stipitatus DSM 14675]